MRADFEKMKATEVEELTEAFKAVKTQMATELEANVDIKEKLETDLTTTKHSLLDIKHQLNMAEKAWYKIIKLFSYKIMIQYLLLGTGKKV